MRGLWSNTRKVSLDRSIKVHVTDKCCYSEPMLSTAVIAELASVQLDGDVMNDSITFTKWIFVTVLHSATIVAESTDQTMILVSPD